MDIQEKVRIFEASCQRLLKSEVTELSNSIDNEIETQIKDELEEYQQKEELTYNKKIENMEKEYNKKVYTLLMESKKQVLEQKKELQKNLKSEVSQLLINFTNSAEYESFLFTKINEALNLLKNISGTNISLINKDFEKYGNQIKENYKISNINVIDDKYIGGCILENKEQGIYIDNTIFNGIEEALEKNN